MLQKKKKKKKGSGPLVGREALSLSFLFSGGFRHKPENFKFKKA